MGTTVNVGINVSSNGTTDNETKKALKLKDVLVQASAAGSKINTGGGAGGGGGMGGGPRAAALADYGTQRAISVGTGAGARDFAKESEGLGGLVRVYATFAANVYAVGAAFSALSAAMDTANMVQGLDQLGAASGRSLGYLAKSLASVTGGALSLRDSMDAVAKGSAAGLSADQIMRMGKAATTASQALGIGLPDAISRLSRGISKLEPELLDELGIYTKLGQSTDAYAQSVGKGASQLTDFEKRQAYANAVLTEAEQKFGKIKIDTNPYAKLAASFTNIIQSGLELVNKVLAPIVSLLASSPTALVLVLGSIGTILLKQAIPAFGQLTQAIQAASDKALIDVAKKSTPYKQKLVIDQAAITASAEAIAESNISALDKAERKFLKTTEAGKTVKVRGILAKPAADITESDIGYLTARSEKHKDTNEKLSKTYSDLAVNVAKYKESEGAATEAIKEGKRRAAEAADDSKKRMLADVDFQNQSISAVQKSMSVKSVAALKEHGYWKSLTVAITEYKAARAGSTLSLPTGEFEKTKTGKDKLKGGQKIPVMQEIPIAPLGRTTAGMGALGAVASSTASAISGVVGKLGVYGMAAAAIYEVGSSVVSMFSATNKESQATVDSLDRLSAAGKTVSDTLADINSRPIFERLTIESIQARTTAFGELTTSLTGMLKATNEEMGKMNWMDKQIDDFKSIFKMDVQSKAAEGFATGLQKSFKAAAPSAATTEAKDKIAKTLGVSDINNIEEVEKAYKKLGGSAGPQIKLIIDDLAKFSKEQQIASARATELEESWKSSSKALTAFMTSSMPQDPLSKLAQGMMTDSLKMTEALKDPITSLAIMTKAATSTDFLKLFPPEAALQLASYATELKDMSVQSAVAEKSISGFDDQIAKLTMEKNEISITYDLPNQDELIADIDSRLSGINEAKKYKVGILADITTAQEPIKKVFGNALRDQFVDGANIMTTKIAAEWAKASTTVSGTLAGFLTDSKAGIDIRAKNDKIAVQAQLDTAKVQLNLIVATNRLADRIELQQLGPKVKELAEGTDAKAYALAKERQTYLEDKMAGNKPALTSQNLIKAYGAQDGGAGAITQADITSAQQEEASRAAIAVANAQLKSVELKKQVELMNYESALSIKNLGNDREAIQLKIAAINAVETVNGISSDTQITDKKALQDQLDFIDAKQQQATLTAKIAVMEFVRLKLSKEDAQLSGQTIDNEVERLQNVDAINIALSQGSKMLGADAVVTKSLADSAKARLQYTLDTAKLGVSTDFSARATELEVSGILLENQKAMGTLLPDEYRNRKLILDLANEQLNSDKAKVSLTDKFLADIAVQSDLLNKATSDEGKTLIQARLLALGIEFDTELNGISKVSAARKAAFEESSKYSDRQNAYADVFKNAFSGMTDAIVNFAKTGKLSFTDLINNMVEGILRYELQLQTMAMWAAVKPGMMSFIGNLFGSPTGPEQLSGPGMPNAKGAAYDNGIKKFAMGGAFSNSIVSSPTMFKFAKGTGLMGEAGPEAIMPLKRDSNGNLGVRGPSGQGGGSNVEVVVNNYGTEKAKTTETKDSRGNRKIEVIIGDASASEITRNGSSSQRSMRSTYGLQPQLVRR